MNAEIVRSTAREVLRETSGKPRRVREEWWWKQDTCTRHAESKEGVEEEVGTDKETGE